MNKDTLLHRQINPSWVHDGRVTSQAFKPTPKDDKRLSVYDGDQISAEDSWHHFTEELEHESVGVRSVTVEECTDVELPVEPDPEPFPEHVVIRFDGCPSTNQIEKKAKKLNKSAEARGWLYQAEVTG